MAVEVGVLVATGLGVSVAMGVGIDALAAASALVARESGGLALTGVGTLGATVVTALGVGTCRLLLGSAQPTTVSATILSTASIKPIRTAFIAPALRASTALLHPQLIVLAFGFDRGRYHHFGAVHLLDGLRAHHSHAHLQRAHQVLRAVGDGCGAE